MSTRKLGQERVSLPPARTDTCSPTPFSGGGCPDSWVPHRGEITRDCISQQHRGSGSAVDGPHSVLDTSPPHPAALPCLGKRDACLLSTVPDRGAELSAVPAARGKEPNRVVQSSVDHSRFPPWPNTLGCGASPAGPEAVPRSPSTVTGKWQRRRPRASHHEQLCSAKIPPRKGPQLSTTSLIKVGLSSNSSLAGAELVTAYLLVRGPLKPEARGGGRGG